MAVGAVAGIALTIATRGIAHTFGVALAGACIVVDVQLGLTLMRARRSDPRDT